MAKPPSRTVLRVLTWTAALLVLKVTVEVMLGYRNYLPPDFDADFLRGRESYFFRSYQWPFYVHIVTGPPSLFLGLLLLHDRFRSRFPAAHRVLGRVQVADVLLFVVPSGLWMAWYAAAGPIAGVAFAVLSVLTGLTIAMGWRAAMARKFAEHRRWMLRNFLLLCSAVVIRVLGGLATVLEVQSPWFDPIASWASWIVPLATFEVVQLSRTHRIVPPSALTRVRQDATAVIRPELMQE